MTVVRCDLSHLVSCLLGDALDGIGIGIGKERGGVVCMHNGDVTPFTWTPSRVENRPDFQVCDSSLVKKQR